MGRIDKLPANYLSTEISKLQSQLMQLKGSQGVGSSGLETVRITNPGSGADFTMSLAYGATSIWEITFTPADRTFANTSFVWHAFFDIVSYTSTSYTTITEGLLPSSQRTYVYRIYGICPASGETCTLGIKMVFYTLGNGTFSISQIQ